MSKIKNKKVKKLMQDHEYYSNKVEEIERERSVFRDFGHKALLIKLKKTKLYLKDQIDRLLKNEA
jgi:uncharacterized protein YdcH (DUF465 family)